VSKVPLGKKELPLRKEKIEFPPMTFVRDSREKEGAGWKFNATSNCNGTITKKLDTGDYSIEGMEHLIMIERKTISDLWGTLVQNHERFMKEMERALIIPSRYLVIEGTMRDILAGCFYSKVGPEFILSSLTVLEQQYGIHVIYLDKRHDICQRYMRRLLEKLYKLHLGALKNGRPINTVGPASPD
jgi:ERCC4-type nuclease